MPGDQRVTKRNAAFQEWQALLSNRAKRQRLGVFLVHGVRPISLAVEHNWPLSALLYNDNKRLSSWANAIAERVTVPKIAVASELLQELSEKDDGAVELIALAKFPDDDLARIPTTLNFLGVLFDRPTNPGNIGTVIRTLDAFGGTGLIVCGHAADPYDPKALRASTGSLFTIPIVRSNSPTDVLEWRETLRTQGISFNLVGTDEHGDVDLDQHDLKQPSLILIGNETNGLSAAWRQACAYLLRIPMTGSASSLNAANAASVVLYEASRQRRQA